MAGGGTIMLPSSVHDFENPELAALIGKTQQSPAAGALDEENKSGSRTRLPSASMTRASSTCRGKRPG
ncbi:hypothetical protein [Xanthobacter autotrophicus]|uniref:hypothetical protein n=1 Tax=Xanthobacter autotrophicus TaxID=280 RepID=UPI0024AC8C58|nr:hypothetical protein [Xanthobacter autotrophicus]